MCRLLSFLGVLLISGVASATSAPQYEGQFETKATAYNGSTFDRHFNVSVQFMPWTEIIASASVHEVLFCKSFDEPSLDCPNISAWEVHCETSVHLDLGQVRIQVRDAVTGETVLKTLPWTADVSDSYKKGDENCATTDLEGKSVVGSVQYLFPLKSAVNGKQASLFIEAEPKDVDMQLSDFAMASKLSQLMNGDTYYVAPFEPNSKAAIFWQYSHTPDWGTSGHVTLKQK